MTADMEMLSEVIRLLESGKKVALCTIVEKVSSGPRDVGTKMVVSENGQTLGTIGGGTMERALIKESLAALKEGKSRKAIFSLRKAKREGVIETGLICGGETTLFIDVIKPKQRLIIVGTGHVAWSLAKMAAILDLAITIVDDDKKTANAERYPMAENVVTGDFNDILGQISVGSNDSVVIVHGEPEHDYKALEEMIKRKPAYLGLLGSKAKVATLTRRLKAAGINDEDLDNFHAPIGLEIAAQTPEEIAISILAEIIMERRKSLGSV